MGDRPASAAAEPTKSALRSYRYLPVARTAAKGFKKGSKVYLLDDPKGRTWVMTSYTDKIVTELTIDKLETLGSLLTLPPGWKFRAAALDKELVLVAKSGSAATMQDDKENIYDLTVLGRAISARDVPWVRPSIKTKRRRRHGCDKGPNQGAQERGRS